MSSKRAMRQAQKQSYAKHRSNIRNKNFKEKKILLIQIKKTKKINNKKY